MKLTPRAFIVYQLLQLKQNGVKKRANDLLKKVKRKIYKVFYQFSYSKKISVSTFNDFALNNRIFNASLTRKSTKTLILYYIDHTVKCSVNSGVQRVVRQVVRGLCEQKLDDLDIIYVKWSSKLKTIITADHKDIHHLEKWSGPHISFSKKFIPKNSKTISELINEFSDTHNTWLLIPEVTHLNYHNLDLTFPLINIANSLNIYTAFIFYDALPLRRPELEEMASIHEKYMMMLSFAKCVFPISHHSSIELKAYFHDIMGLSESSTPIIKHLLLPSEVTDVPRSVTINERSANVSKYILCVGSIEVRKNQLLLAKSFLEILLAGHVVDCKLIFIGNLNPAIADEFIPIVRSSQQIEWISDCSDSDLQLFYRDCLFTVFPSVDEGFGLPIAESLWFGKPCICSESGSMNEIAEQGGCLTIDTSNPLKLKDSILQLINHEKLLNDLSRQAFSASLTTWKMYSKNILDSLVHIDKNAFSRINIIFLVGNTIDFDGNTGIQRVTRGLAKSLQVSNYTIVPKKWNSKDKAFVDLNNEEISRFASYNGPYADLYSSNELFDENSPTWVILPELPYYSAIDDYYDICAAAKSQKFYTAAIFYDAIPWSSKAIYSQEVRMLHAKYMDFLLVCDLVFPISNTSSNALKSYYLSTTLDTSKAVCNLQTCILPGEFTDVERVLSPDTRSCFESNIDSSKPIYMLCVSTIEPRKNHTKLLESFTSILEQSSRPLRLILAGRNSCPNISSTIFDYIRRYPRSIEWIDSPSEDELKSLYRNCHFTIFPSIEEGFGLPILESIWYGKPCICSGDSSMGEISSQGGCINANVQDITSLASSMLALCEDHSLYVSKVQEATSRTLKTWNEYASEIVYKMINNSNFNQPISNDLGIKKLKFQESSHIAFSNIPSPPVLSICISTYNRSKWLSVSLPIVLAESAPYGSCIEVVACDNASTDSTRTICESFLDNPQFKYIRNPSNVGMLGNLSVTSQNARGRYVWILGDDDILTKGSVPRIMNAIEGNQGVDLLYLNYSYTTLECPSEKSELVSFFKSAIPATNNSTNFSGKISDISHYNENFFTAIYTLVFKRQHALLAYCQDTSGVPFSSLSTCVPTTKYILENMMNLRGYWISTPSVVVNMNVSWSKYAWRWILQRFPEIFTRTVLHGADPDKVDIWRANHLPSIIHYLQKIIDENSVDAFSTISLSDLELQIKHLPDYREYEEQFQALKKAFFDSNLLRSKNQH